MLYLARGILIASLGVAVWAASAWATNILNPEVNESLLAGDATGVNYALAAGIAISGMIIAVLWRAYQASEKAREELHGKRVEDAKSYAEAVQEHRDLMIRTTVLIERMERRMGD